MFAFVCVAHTGLCSFSSLPRVTALKRLTLGCYVWPFQGLGLLCPSAVSEHWVTPVNYPFRDRLGMVLGGTDPARFSEDAKSLFQMLMDT
jgi:hypothetical protein